MTILITDFSQVSIFVIVVCDPVVDASVLLPVMLRRDTVTEVILPVDLGTGWQLDAGNVTISVQLVTVCRQPFLYIVEVHRLNLRKLLLKLVQSIL